MRTVWRLFDHRDKEAYVPRCAKCGGYKDNLYIHWFFRGQYCRECIQYTLYDDCRRIEDIK